MSLIQSYLKLYGDVLNTIPSIYYLWKEAQPFVEMGDEAEIKKIENLIFLLFNSVVSPKTKLGKNVKFAYGGIGTVIHKDALIGDGVSIGQGVTIGGTPGSFGIRSNGTRHFVPIINENVYVAAGSRIFGGITVGRFSVIGANSVLSKDSDPFSIYAGQPARKITTINKKNCRKYRAFFHSLKGVSDVEYMALFPD